MKLSGQMSRQQRCLPGVVGSARVERRPGDLLNRVRPGDIAILDQLDLDRRTAAALVDARVVGVVNAAPSISGRFPNIGPEVLLSAGVALIDGVGTPLLQRIKDGTKIRMHCGRIFAGTMEIGRGKSQNVDSVADRLIEAKAGMSAQLEAFSANTIEFLRRERMLVLDGVGVPELSVPMRDKHVLVVAAGRRHADELKRLKWYIKEYRPVLVGVDAGAETLRRCGHAPAVIVGNPATVSSSALRCDAEMVVPTHPDSDAREWESFSDRGLQTVRFTATGNHEDLALLLADAHGASLVVTVGFHATLHEFLDRGRSGSNSSTFLTRLKLGNKLVDASAIAALRPTRVPTGALCLLVAAVMALTSVALTVSGLGEEYLPIFAEVGRSAEGAIRSVLP